MTNLHGYISLISKTQIKTLILLLIITPFGFLCKYYSGPVEDWINNSIAGLLYEIFWILAAFFFFPHKKYISKIVIWVFVTTCFLEFLQLWHPWILEQIRSTFIGRILLGTTFVWWDFPHYFIGCFTGWFIIKRIE
jgi:hypothetical protein